MNSIKCPRIVMVAGKNYDLAARLRRMDFAQVRVVGCIEEARHLCEAGETDACLVAIGPEVADAAPAAERDAPGRACGIPSFIVAPVVTLHLRRAARRCGYLAAVPAATPVRLVYRRISAALQRRGGRLRRRRSVGGMPVAGRLDPAVFDKPTLH